MLFFRKKSKFPLPRFPSSVIPTFKMLLEVIDEEQLEGLRQSVEKFHQDFRNKSRKDTNIDLVDVEQLVQVCRYLLSRYNDFDARGRSLIVAAVRYVAVAEDPFSESIFATGFFDDKRVVNHVLEQLGIEDRYLKLEE